MLSGHGLPEIPEGGSVESLLKSRIRRRLQLVDYRNCVLARRLTEGSVCTNHREVRVRWWWPWLWRRWQSLSEICLWDGPVIVTSLSPAATNNGRSRSSVSYFFHSIFLEFPSLLSFFLLESRTAPQRPTRYRTRRQVGISVIV